MSSKCPPLLFPEASRIAGLPVLPESPILCAHMKGPSTASIHWDCLGRRIAFDRRPLIMGILNVTPDSFSDGGQFVDPAAAIDRGLALIRDGADMVDVGGESTRPGAQPVAVAEELARVIPVIAELARQTDALISVDTVKSQVAEAAIRAGAHIVNDVSALEADPHMAQVAKDTQAGVVLMHRQGSPATMQVAPAYDDVVADIRAYLARRLDALAAFGLSPDALAIDPGIGFGKTAEHNIRLLASLATFRSLGRPLLVGLSRKRFLESMTGRPVNERLAGSLAALCWCIGQGADIMRVHDVKESRDAASVWHAFSREQQDHG